MESSTTDTITTTTSSTLETLKYPDVSNTGEESLVFLNNFIKDAIENNRLDHPIDETDSCDTSRILRLVGEYSNKDEITKLIEEWRSKILHNWVPKILTLGGFIFGCYYRNHDSLCFGENISCAPVCAFSIPKFTNDCKVCEANVMYFIDDTTNLYLNNNSETCYVYLKSTIVKFHFTEKLIKSLKDKNCKLAIIIQNNKVIRKIEIETTSPCEIITSEFPTSHIEPTEECKKESESSSSSESSSPTQCESENSVADYFGNLFSSIRSEYAKFITNLMIGIIIIFLILLAVLIYQRYYCK